MERDEAGTLELLQAHRKELCEPEIERHHGRIFKVLGDGLLVEFGSAIDAVECAVALQSGTAKANAESPADDRRIELRVGVNLGDVVVEGSDLYGDGVNLAARLQELAEPGGICVSAKVCEEVGRKVEIGFEDFGEQQLKNMAKPVHVFMIRPAPPLSAANSQPLALPEKPSIAVLPFDNLSRDAEQQYFSDGIAEDIITDLSKVSGLFVIARNSAFTFRGRAVNVQDVSRALGVRYVLEGSVRKAGNRVRIAAQLIDGTTGGDVPSLWQKQRCSDNRKPCSRGSLM